MSDTHPDLGWASGPVELHLKVVGRAQVPLLLELEALVELEELLELPLSHPPEVLEDELELLDDELELLLLPPSQPASINAHTNNRPSAKQKQLFVFEPLALNKNVFFTMGSPFTMELMPLNRAAPATKASVGTSNAAAEIGC